MNFIKFDKEYEDITGDHFLNQILWFNGIKSLDDYKEYKEISFPFLYDNFDQFVDRINKAVINSEKVMIIGDYDCDGVCATSILVKFLQKLEIDVSYTIGSRFIDGYGMNNSLVDKAISMNISLIITCDNGIKSKNEVSYANYNKIDVIVTDHHQIDDGSLPDCLIFNPHMKQSNIKFRDVCGALVAFSLIFSYNKHPNALKTLDKVFIQELYELSAIATLGDVMPLHNINRAIVRNTVLNYQKGLFYNCGIKKIFDLEKIDYQIIDEQTIQFKIIPLLNAPGRLENASIVVDLLLTDDEIALKSIISEMKVLNEKRKEETKKKDLLKINKDENIIVCYSEYLNEGVIGIIAGQIKEQTKKPTFVFTKSADDTIKGSARSVGKFNILNLTIKCLKENEIDVIEYGGHEKALGITFKNIDDLNKFKKAINEMYLDTNLFNEECYYITTPKLSFEQISERFDYLMPYGERFNKPLLMIEGVAESVEIKKEAHSFFNIKNGKNLEKMVAFYNIIDEKKHTFFYEINKSIFGEKKYYKGNIKKII